MRAFAECDVCLAWTVKFNLQSTFYRHQCCTVVFSPWGEHLRIREHRGISRRRDERNKDLITLLCSDVLSVLVDSDTCAVDGLDVPEDTEGVGETRAFEDVFGESLVGFDGLESGETDDLGPVGFVGVLEVEVYDLRALFVFVSISLRQGRVRIPTAVAVFATNAAAVPTKISATSLCPLPAVRSFCAILTP